MTRESSSFIRHMEEVWKELADQLQAQYVEGQAWKTDQIIAQVEDRTVRLGFSTMPGFKSEKTFTRLHTVLPADVAFKCSVESRGVISKAAAQLGLSPVETDYKNVEEKYQVLSNSSERMQQILDDERARRFMLERGDVHFEINENVTGEETARQAGHELICEVPEILADLEALKQLYGLFAHILRVVEDNRP